MKQQGPKLWNGRGQYRWVGTAQVKTGHVYIAAHSRADAVRLMKEAGFIFFTQHELDVYFAKNTWGISMEGIKPERGIWANTWREEHKPGAVPERIL